MTALIAWARDLAALALFGYLLELLLPSRTMEGYVRLVVGLVILAALVSPLLKWLRPGEAVRLNLPGASAQGVKTVFFDENRYANGESSQILDVFSGQAAKATEEALRHLPGVLAPRVRIAVSSDPSSAEFGQIRGASVVFSSARPSRSLIRQAERVVAKTLGIPGSAVEMRVLSRASPQGLP